MRLIRTRSITASLLVVFSLSLFLAAQGAGSSSSLSAKHAKQPAAAKGSTSLEPGSVVMNIYRNKMLGLTCKVPVGWVLRTEEMNTPLGAASDAASGSGNTGPASTVAARVLLAAFSRPPDARGEDVNSSILIAAENQFVYPGLKEAAQYFGPLIEVAKAQGLTPDEDPYEVAVGGKTLVRGDFHKNVGSRVMHQSTLAMLSHGYAISITLIGGTDDEVEELIDGLSFVTGAK
jgi:hypothetical protein